MKSSILKRTLSLILALIMLVSVCTVAVVNTVAAETDTATTSATITGGTTLYLKPNANWKADGARFAAYFCNGSSAAKWYSAFPNDDGYYWVTVQDGESHANIIWCRMNPANTTNNWDTKWDQTNDLTWDGTKNLYTVAEGAWSKGNGSWSVYTPVGDVDPAGTYHTIYFRDDTSDSYITNDDSNMFVYTNAGDKVQMTETVDTLTGKTLWSAKIDDNATRVTFYRASYYYDEDNASSTQWGTWSAGDPGENTLYKATSSGNGSWTTDTVEPADAKAIENFSYGLWIDSKGEGKAEHAIKWYLNGTKYELYVPSFVNLASVPVYTSFGETFTIDGETYSNGDLVDLSEGATHTVNTTTSFTVYQTVNTAAMLMTTKEELFTGLTDNYMDANAWPTGSGITATNFNGVYKDAIETKGSYYFYTEDGTFLNSNDTVLKKIKGRGNSSFEASMRVYGKYAYNFNLDTKQELIEGSTASKKWCMLANNVDHTMMRNTFIYQLADELELACAPETRLVDVYDNGKYLGAFVITEKVEYGKNTLMAKDSQGKTIKNLDDGNTDANSVFTDDGEDYIYEFDTDDLQDGIKETLTVNGQDYEYKYYAKYNRPDVYEEDEETGEEILRLKGEDNLDFESPENYNTEYNYLLEHELASRYQAEASWFVTPNGQPVVVKYPEFATQEEMIWIIKEYAAMEQAVYADNYDGENGYANLIDVESFAKMYLIQELAINLDSCATSYYIHNEFRNGKSVLVAGPVWDYDWSMGAYAGGKKWIYNGTTVSPNENSLANPEQMFVKNKAIQTDDAGQDTAYGVDWAENYNLQAKMAHNDDFWTVCQSIYTNDMVPVLYEYTIDDYDDKTDGGILVDELLPKFQSSMDMNNARWGVYNFPVDKALGGDDWGTKITSDYVKGTGITNTSNFYYNLTTKSGNATKCYANTVYYLNDWLSTRKDYMSGTGDLYDADLKYSYTFKNVSFNYDQSADESTLSLKPIATVTYGSTVTGTTEVPAEQLMYTVYVNGAPYQTYKFTEEATIKFEENSRNEVYIVVFPAADTNATGESEPQEFTYGKVPVEVTIYFKSSGSYRYAPTLTVNGGSEIVMDKAEEDFNHNPSRTQKYYWYSCTVELDSAKASTLQFSNAYAMRATVSLSDVVENGEYYFGCDNMNNGSTAVNLTGCDEYIKNFVKSATHMVYNDATDAGVATTSIDGTVYKMGDVDGDNTVSILDATTAQMALVEKIELNDTQTALADYDLDQVNSIADVTLTQRYLVNN